MSPYDQPYTLTINLVATALMIDLAPLRSTLRPYDQPCCYGPQPDQLYEPLRSTLRPYDPRWRRVRAHHPRGEAPQQPPPRGVPQDGVEGDQEAACQHTRQDAHLPAPDWSKRTTKVCPKVPVSGTSGGTWPVRSDGDDAAETT
eukprot:6930949-Pyramimonas_sp.AAC.1